MCLNESDWMRIGAFFLESSSVLITERLSTPLKFPKEESVQQMLESCGSCVLNDVKPGIWIAGTFNKTQISFSFWTSQEYEVFVIYDHDCNLLLISSAMISHRSPACSVPRLRAQYL